MYTSVLLVALSSGFACGELIPSRSLWLNDYSLALERGLAQARPLAVFFGTGDTGWGKINKEGSLSKEGELLLQSHYVCLYVDMSKKPGQELAQAFAISHAVGLVISDQSGKLQAFCHSGDLKSADLDRYLRRYADANRLVATTETTEDTAAAQRRPAPARTYVVRNC